MSETSDRSRLVALVLAGILGWAGAHRFYAGKVGTGLLQLFTGGGLGIWWFIDTIVIASGGFRDAEGLPMIYWSEAEARLGGGAEAGEMWEEIDALRAEVRELSERVDYSERLLTRSRAE